MLLAQREHELAKEHALLTAADCGHMAVVKLLLAHIGPTNSARDLVTGILALARDKAKKGGHSAIARLLWDATVAELAS